MESWLGVIIVGSLWLVGAVITATLQFVLVHIWDKRDGITDKNPFIAAAAILGINLFLWPFVFRSVWEWYGPRLAVKLRLKPEWTIESGNERSFSSWRLKDEAGLQAEAICYSPGEPTHIKVVSDHDEIDYRVRMIAPRETPPTEWTPLKRPSKAAWARSTRRLRERGEYYDESPAFSASPELKPGKYHAEFRVHLSTGELEEVSQLTFVVPQHKRSLSKHP
ncbi:MAG: hypothetical protein KJ070_01685 [Verrucomicrobia bacterium]|nr:hypothetical protein [Verrucomicrobiota bacterium]